MNITSTQAEIDASIKAAVGDAAYAQYKNYDQTMAQRTTTDQLTQRLSYSGTPLTADQSAAMLQILTQTAAPRATTTAGVTTNVAVAIDTGGGRGGGGPMNLLGGGGGGGTAITDATITMAQGVLSAPQVDALKQIQQEQQAQQQIGQALRQTIGNGNPGTTTTTTTRKKGGG